MKPRPTPTRILDDDATKAAKPIVLVLLGAYWPNHDATGPNQSFRAYVAALSDEFEFMVVGRDGPSGSDSPDASRGRWTDDGLVKTRHCRISPLGAEGLRDILRATPHDLIILNGFFDREFTIPALAMRRLGLIPRLPTILAPRGEFSAGALGLKHARKQAYLLAARGLGLLDDVWLHATSEQEADEIRDGCPWARDIVVAPNIRVLGPMPQAAAPADDGRLRIVFLSRVDRKKNLDYAIKLLAHARAPVTFDIFGPANDPAYWAECEQLISRLPAHVEVHYRGSNSQRRRGGDAGGIRLVPIADARRELWSRDFRRLGGWPAGFNLRSNAVARVGANRRGLEPSSRGPRSLRGYYRSNGRARPHRANRVTPGGASIG